jgi:hypothetical protein
MAYNKKTRQTVLSIWRVSFRVLSKRFSAYLEHQTYGLATAKNKKGWLTGKFFHWPVW